MNKEFIPKLFSLLKKGIPREQLGRDAMSGIIVGIVALPLAIAFAIASGVSPEKGLITAIVAGLVISALGGSRVQIGGPTGAFIVIVYAIVQDHGVGGLTIATFMAGFLLIGMGLFRFGNLLKYFPYPLIVGFTSGIAVIIFSSQIKDFLGLPEGNRPADFFGKWTWISRHISSIDPIATAISLATVIIAMQFHRISKKIPGSIIAILLSTLAVWYFKFPVQTIETAFGEIPNKLSLPLVPTVDWDTIRALVQPALAIALLGGIESLLSAVVADGMMGGKHRPNAELIAQGGANILSAMFGGIPATGAIARTATNVRNGGRTPIAGIIHALVLLLIMLLFAPLAKLIPMACLAGILVVVAYNMSEWRHFVSLLKSNRLDVLVMLTTFALTVIFDLILAIEVGVVLSSIVFMKRMSETLKVEAVTSNGAAGDEVLFEEELQEIPEGVLLYEINGALFFGVASKFQDTINDLRSKPRIVVLRMRNVPMIDASGMHALMSIIQNFKQKKTDVILSGVNNEVLHELENAGIYTLIPKENVTGRISLALERSREVLRTS